MDTAPAAAALSPEVEELRRALRVTAAERDAALAAKVPAEAAAAPQQGKSPRHESPRRLLNATLRALRAKGIFSHEEMAVLLDVHAEPVHQLDNDGEPKTDKAGQPQPLKARVGDHVSPNEQQRQDSAGNPLRELVEVTVGHDHPQSRAFVDAVLAD